MIEDFENNSFILDVCDKLLNSNQLVSNILDEDQVIDICEKVSIILKRESMLLRADAPINICGDIHGQFHDLQTIFKIGGQIKDKQKYLFLGDYVDRGQNSIECIVLLFLYKIVYPNSIYLLRGNHEDRNINKTYGFYSECQKKMSVDVWEAFNGTFDYMPVAAIVSQKIFCCHGGISPELQNLKQIKEIKRPISVPDEGLLCDLLWADPLEGTECWGENEHRSVGCTFGSKAVESFLKMFDFEMICRAHEYAENGHQFKWQKKCVTVFSASNYLGIEQSKGAILVVAKNLDCNVVQYDSKGNVVNSNSHNNSKKNKNKK